MLFPNIFIIIEKRDRGRLVNVQGSLLSWRGKVSIHQLMLVVGDSKMKRNMVTLASRKPHFVTVCWWLHYRHWSTNNGVWNAIYMHWTELYGYHSNNNAVNHSRQIHHVNGILHYFTNYGLTTKKTERAKYPATPHHQTLTNKDQFTCLFFNHQTLVVNGQKQWNTQLTFTLTNLHVYKALSQTFQFYTFCRL